MKKIAKYLIPLFMGVMMNTAIKAQTDVKLLDLSIMKNFKKMQKANLSDSIDVMVHFKINKAAEGAKVHFLLGSAKDKSDILVAEPVFNTTGGKTYVAYNKVSREVKKYEAVFYLKMSQAAYHNFLAATLYVETTNGQMTSKLYYTKR